LQSLEGLVVEAVASQGLQHRVLATRDMVMPEATGTRWLRIEPVAAVVEQGLLVRTPRIMQVAMVALVLRLRLPEQALSMPVVEAAAFRQERI
jgi:hypothetical protein